MAKKRGKAPKAKSKPNGKAREPKRKGPRSQALPGLEQARDQVMDALLEDLGEIRTQQNSLHLQEREVTGSVLKRMRERDYKVRKHGGVEVVFVPGGDKLRVRVTKEHEESDESASVFKGDLPDKVDPSEVPF